MAMAKEIMGASLIDRSSFLRKQSQFVASPFLVPLEKRRSVPLRKVVRGPTAAISEDLVKKALPLPLPLPADKAEKFKVRAVVTIRNKSKEDLKDSLVKHLDAFADKIGRNVVLQLVSTEIDPSMPISLFF
jgi:lipoxygenase